ncbi:hypothetical protein HK102_011772, partial [Quaeritorhiza haematococci]
MLPMLHLPISSDEGAACCLLPHHLPNSLPNQLPKLHHEGTPTPTGGVGVCVLCFHWWRHSESNCALRFVAHDSDFLVVNTGIIGDNRKTQSKDAVSGQDKGQKDKGQQMIPSRSEKPPHNESSEPTPPPHSKSEQPNSSDSTSDSNPSITSHSQHPQQLEVLSLSPDIWILICRHLSRASHILALGVTCKYLYSVLLQEPDTPRPLSLPDEVVRAEHLSDEGEKVGEETRREEWRGVGLTTTTTSTVSASSSSSSAAAVWRELGDRYMRWRRTMKFPREAYALVPSSHSGDHLASAGTSPEKNAASTLGQRNRGRWKLSTSGSWWSASCGLAVGTPRPTSWKQRFKERYLDHQDVTARVHFAVDCILGDDHHGRGCEDGGRLSYERHLERVEDVLGARFPLDLFVLYSALGSAEYHPSALRPQHTVSTDLKAGDDDWEEVQGDELESAATLPPHYTSTGFPPLSHNTTTPEEQDEETNTCRYIFRNSWNESRHAYRVVTPVEALWM